MYQLAENQACIRVLECPVCFEYMHSKIYLCLKGHSICRDCHPKLSRCPICKEKIGRGRNYVAETLSMYLQLSCKYFQNGCKEMLNINELSKHQKSCVFRGDRICPVNNIQCSWMGTYTAMMDHMKTNHNMQIENCDTSCILIFSINPGSSQYSQIRILSKWNEIFRFYCEVNDDTARMAVQFIGPSEKTSNFKYGIEIVNSTNGKQITLAENCHAFSKIEDMFDDSKGFELTYNTWGQYILDGKGTISVSVTLDKIK